MEGGGGGGGLDLFEPLDLLLGVDRLASGTLHDLKSLVSKSVVNVLDRHIYFSLRDKTVRSLCFQYMYLCTNRKAAILVSVTNIANNYIQWQRVKIISLRVRRNKNKKPLPISFTSLNKFPFHDYSFKRHSATDTETCPIQCIHLTT